MKLSELILGRPLFVAFGTSQQTGGLTSVDLAATRDDSQVVISASDGSVAPVAGADATTAGVMTAADKAALEALPPTTTREFAARADIAQATVSAATTHLRSAGYSAAGDGGGAVYTRAGAEPAHALKVQSLDGAWWELVPDIAGVSVRQAGAVGDDATDDSQAFLDALGGAGDFNAAGVNVATNRVVVPPGAYYLGATTLELKKMVHLTGLGSGQVTPAQPAHLRWDANVTGLIVHRENTIGAGVESPGTGAADGSIIEGLRLKGGGGSIASITDDTKGHGIWLRTRAVLRDLIVEGFAGNGVHIVATAGSGDNAREGNANEWLLQTARLSGCHQHGLYTEGADVNAGYASKVDVTGNGRWGIYDSSFLGNTYVGCHAANNGVANRGENVAGESSFVSLSNRRYAANVNATEADLVATQPGTNENVWLDITSGGSSGDLPLWEAGKPEGTYFHGGSYHTDSANAKNIFLGCYNEINHAAPQFVYPTTYFAGDGFTPKGTFGGLGGNSQGIELFGDVKVHNHNLYDADRDYSLTLNPAKDKLLELKAGGDSGWSFQWDEVEGWMSLIHGDLNSRKPIRLTTNHNTTKFGRASAIPGGELILWKGFWVGWGPNSRYFFQADAAPTSGEHAKGDTILNASPTVQTDTDGIDWIIYGWKCTASGTPGTWQTLWTRVSTPPGL